jgi:hypothetical protein
LGWRGRSGRPLSGRPEAPHGGRRRANGWTQTAGRRVREAAAQISPRFCTNGRRARARVARHPRRHTRPDRAASAAPTCRHVAMTPCHHPSRVPLWNRTIPILGPRLWPIIDLPIRRRTSPWAAAPRRPDKVKSRRQRRLGATLRNHALTDTSLTYLLTFVPTLRKHRSSVATWFIGSFHLGRLFAPHPERP